MAKNKNKKVEIYPETFESLKKLCKHWELKHKDPENIAEFIDDGVQKLLDELKAVEETSKNRKSNYEIAREQKKQKALEFCKSQGIQDPLLDFLIENESDEFIGFYIVMKFLNRQSAIEQLCQKMLPFYGNDTLISDFMTDLDEQMKKMKEEKVEEKTETTEIIS